MDIIGYSYAATEVLEILKHMEKEAINKIPKNFIKFLEENSSKEYKPKFDFNQPIKELNLKSKTKGLLGLIYLKYWANEEEKKAFTKKLKENEEKYQNYAKQKYNSDNLFKNNRNLIIRRESQTVEQVELPVVYNKTIIQMIIQKIKKFFRK